MRKSMIAQPQGTRVGSVMESMSAYLIRRSIAHVFGEVRAGKPVLTLAPIDLARADKLVRRLRDSGFQIVGVGRGT